MWLPTLMVMDLKPHPYHWSGVICISQGNLVSRCMPKSWPKWAVGYCCKESFICTSTTHEGSETPHLNWYWCGMWVHTWMVLQPHLGTALWFAFQKVYRFQGNFQKLGWRAVMWQGLIHMHIYSIWPLWYTLCVSDIVEEGHLNGSIPKKGCYQTKTKLGTKLT